VSKDDLSADKMAIAEPRLMAVAKSREKKSEPSEV
jgi:hypothetical protein